MTKEVLYNDSKNALACAEMTTETIQNSISANTNDNTEQIEQQNCNQNDPDQNNYDMAAMMYAKQNGGRG